MSIVSRSSVSLSYGTILGDPFCDYLNVSVPRDSGDLVMRELQPLVDLLGLSEVALGLFKEPKNGGTFKYFHRGKVSIFGVSGGLLEWLRHAGELGNYLRILSGFPHRVTMLHATADYGVAGPPVIASLYRHGRRGRVALTKKRVAGTAVKAILSLDASGRSTGTVYFGHRQNADVWAKVYDKRHERLSRGLPDPGPMVRVEISVQSDVGATLGDALNPSALFFHFASPGLVEVPPCGREWSPHGEGFVAGPDAPAAFPAHRIRAILDSSLDVGRAVDIAIDAWGAAEAGLELSRMVAACVRRKSASRALVASPAVSVNPC